MQPIYKVPSGPAPENESLQRFLPRILRKLSSLKFHVLAPSCVTAIAVNEPSGVDSSLILICTRSGPRPLTGSSPEGNRFNVDIAVAMILFGSLGLTKMMGSPAPRFGLPRRRYSSDLGAFESVCECKKTTDGMSTATANSPRRIRARFVICTLCRETRIRQVASADEKNRAAARRC